MGKRKRAKLAKEEISLEERFRREARGRANRRLAFMGHMLVYLATLTLIAFTGGIGSAIVVALSWGIGVTAHGFFGVLAPELKKEMVEDEVARRLSRSLRAERQTIESRHARSLEQLSASIAHEIRNPITAAKSLVQQMGEDPGSEENLEYARVALEELDRVEASISHLLRYAREEPLRMVPMKLDEVVEGALDASGSRLRESDVELETDIGHDLHTMGDPEKTRRVVLNLLNNALDALQEAPAGSKRIELAAGHSLAGDTTWLRVRDNGPGMSAAQREKIFDPFYTSKENGTGLGLAISRKLVESQGGTLEVQTEPGGGSEFVATFVSAGPEALAEHESEQPEGAARRAETW